MIGGGIPPDKRRRSRTCGYRNAAWVSASRFPRIEMEHLWLALPLFFVSLRGLTRPLSLLDFWWHLKCGEIIVTTGKIPRTDIFSFTAAGNEFVLQNWLAEAIYYLVYRLGGPALMITFNAALLLAAMVPIYLLCLKSAANRVMGIAASSVALVSLLLFSNARPQLFSIALFALFYKVLSDFRLREGDALWILPPLMAIWVNLHGAFVLGLGLILLILISEAFDLWIGADRETLSVRELQKLSLVLLLVLLATTLNPETYRIYYSIRAVMTDAGSQLYISEWQAPRISTLSGVFCFYAPFFVTLIILLTTRRRPDTTDLVIFLFFTAFGLTALRNGIWFSLASSPLIARYLAPLKSARANIAPEFTGAPTCLEKASRQKSHYWLNFLFACIGLLIIVLMSPWLYDQAFRVKRGSHFMEAGTPVRAIDFIEHQRIKGRLFHPQHYGDYLIWRLWPAQHSFFDGRVHAFGGTFVQTYMRIWEDPEWERDLENYGIRYLLLEKGDERGKRILSAAKKSPRWHSIYEDETSILFEKTI